MIGLVSTTTNERCFLNSFDIKIIRFENRLVFEEIEFVIGRISEYFGWRDESDS